MFVVSSFCEPVLPIPILFSFKPLSSRVAYKARTAAKAPKTPATVIPTRTLSELAADEEEAAAVPEEVLDPVAPEAAK